MAILLSMFLFYGIAWCGDARLTCDKVISVTDLSERKIVIRSIEKELYHNMQKTTVKELKLLNKLGKWYITCCSFSNLDPAMFLLYRDKKGIHIIEELSGDINEKRVKETKDVIYDYFVANAPKAPKELIYCSAPRLAALWGD